MLGLDPSDWPAISALLGQAMDVPPASRSAWLEALPPESAAYRDTLKRLFAAGAGAETNLMFEELPRIDIEAVAADAGDAALAAGQRVGPYVLLAQVGRGGMGSVWLAERADAQPRRKVALKLPHLGWAPGLAERVERERDILASLEHPNIARLYDAGVDAIGRPYLALEYIEGTPVDRYAAEHGLHIRDRLSLVLQIAAAVAHAHAHLVVHRDLKPSNILVTAGGDVRLLDFGIARLLEDGEAGEASELTRLHGRALTLEYASPEQIRGERVGTASDVYSLGVVAYELLTGVRPYRLADTDALKTGTATAIQIPPASRSARDPAQKKQLTGDLDAILNKTLKQDPAERYPTVVAFADDIARHLADTPVLARPDTVGYRLRKFVARNALQVSAGALVLLAVAMGTGAALWQARTATLAAARAEQEAARAEQEAARAEQVKRFTLSIFEDADTESGAGAATTAADLLKQATGRVERELADRPEVEVELLTSIAFSLRGQGRNDESAATAATAAAIGQRQLGADHRLSLAAAVVQARALEDLGRVEEALPIVERTIAATRRLGLQHSLVDALQILSSIEIDKGDASAGTADAREAVAIVSAHQSAFSKLDAANAWLRLAAVLRSTNQPGLLDAASQGLALMKEVYGDKPVLPMMTARLLVANGLAEEGQVRSAVGDLASLLDDARHLLGPSHPKVAFFAKFLADARFDAGDYVGAVDAYGSALAIAKAGLSGGPQSVVVIQRALAEALAANGQPAEALAHADAAVAVAAGIKDTDPADATDLASTRGLALMQLGRFDDADAVLTTALARLPAGSRERALLEERLAMLRNLQKRHAEALQLAQASELVLGKDRSRKVHADAERVLGEAFLAVGRNADAVAPLQKALDLNRAGQILVSPEQAATARDLERARRGVKSTS